MSRETRTWLAEFGTALLIVLVLLPMLVVLAAEVL